MLRTFLTRIAPSAIAMLTLVLTVNSNSSGCFIIHQPKAPKALDEFKKIK